MNSTPAPESTAWAAAEHLVGRGRGEDLAGAGGVEHADADEARMQRLVAGAAAGDQRHLAGAGRLGAGDEGGIVMDLDDIGMGGAEAVQGLGRARRRRR